MSKVRVTRGTSFFRVVDLTNAGKRGTCREIVLYNIDFLREPLASSVYSTLNALETLAASVSYDDVARDLRRVYEAIEATPAAIDERDVKAVGVAPADFTPTEIHGAKVFIKAEWDSFTVRDLTDRNNEPTVIPPTRASATAVKRFRKFATTHAEELAELSFSNVLEAMRGEDISYHYFLAVD